MDRFDIVENRAWVSPFGEYVRYSDAQTEIARLKAEVERQRKAKSDCLRLLISARRKARNDALEEAADLARRCTDGCQSCAGTDHEIRALKELPTSEKS